VLAIDTRGAAAELRRNLIADEARAPDVISSVRRHIRNGRVEDAVGAGDVVASPQGDGLEGWRVRLEPALHAEQQAVALGVVRGRVRSAAPAQLRLEVPLARNHLIAPSGGRASYDASCASDPSAAPSSASCSSPSCRG